MLESIMLITALSIDAFVASIAYGAKKIKIPFKSVLTINIVCTTLLGISLYFGAIIRQLIPGNIVSLVGVIILLILGFYQLAESIARSLIEGNIEKNKIIKFNIYDFKFTLKIYQDTSKIGLHKSSKLNAREAFMLALALSIDGLAAGFGSALTNVNYGQVLLLSLVFHMLAVWLGVLLGRKVVERSKFNISWVSGLILISLALVRFVRI